MDSRSNTTNEKEKDKKKYSWVKIATLFLLGASISALGMQKYYTNVVIPIKVTTQVEKVKALHTQEKKQLISMYEAKLNEPVFKNKQYLKNFIMYKNKKLFPELADIIIENAFKYSEKYNIPPAITVFIMGVESNYDIWAKSKVGAVGLMQVNPSVWLDTKTEDNLVEKGIAKTVNDLYTPSINIQAGLHIFNHYLELGKKYQQEGKLQKLGNFNSPLSYAAYRYVGKADFYYERIKNIVGEYWLFVVNNG